MSTPAPIIDIQRGRRPAKRTGVSTLSPVDESYAVLVACLQTENDALIQQGIRQAEQLGRLALIIADLRAQLAASGTGR